MLFCVVRHVKLLLNKRLPYPQAVMKCQRLFGNDPTVFQTCVSDSNRPSLADIETA